MKKRLVLLIGFITFILLVAFLARSEVRTINISSEVKEKVKSGGNARVFIVSEAGREAKIINKNQLDKLEKNFSIRRIEPVGTRHILLQDSVPLINATGAWNLNVSGISLTGKGQAICIIDTGVNYSHPDLGGCYGDNNLSSDCKVIGGWDYCKDNVDCLTEDSIPDDLNGHGTHISGIVAANGSIKGVAPEANIVMIKASNSSGVFWDDRLILAINWCIANATKFNISVISMSLGAGLYSSYCNSDTLASSINSAVANNISVVVASGNDGSSTQISSPACVQNATPVGATDKTDNIFYNRNSLVQLLAPGVLINSTYNGGYTQLSGTSMAAPHVAGAIAIMQQFLSLSGQTKTPEQIKSVLNATGKIIYDSTSGLNFSRIDIYNAIIFMQEIITVLPVSPSNNTFTNINNTNFTCNSTSINPLKNVTFYLWNSSSYLINNQTKNISGTANSTLFNYTFISEGVYLWSCLVFNNNSNSSQTGNYTLTYDRTSPEIYLFSTEDTTSTTINFIFNVSDNSPIDTCSVYIDNQFKTSNSLINKSTNNSISVSELSVRQHSSYVNCTDMAGNSNISQERNFTITAPAVSPAPSGGGGGGGTMNRVYSISELGTYTNTLKTNDQIKFKISEENHSLKVTSLNSSMIKILVESNPVSLTINVEEDKKLDLNGDNYLDLYIRLNSITNGLANLTIKKINESIRKEYYIMDGSVNIQNQQNLNENISGGSIIGGASGKIGSQEYLYITIVILVIVLATYMITTGFKEMRNKKRR